MAGLGKTTLAKKVYNSAIQNFQCAAWIYVSQQPNVTKLLQDIARQVGLEDKKWKHNVEANLFAFLSQRRYLIVMDDIWQNEPWIGLKNGIPTNSNNGSRIILTSRNRNVGVSIGGESSIWKLQPLEQQDSRNLFLKMVGLTEQLEVTTGHLELENIVKKILRKCGGVPLAIVVAAGMLLLRKITVSAWNDVLMNMGEENQISKIFFLSFKDLPIELKPCFLYFGLFPEDYEIFTFDLINMWEAEGLIRSYGNQDIREVGEDFLNHLIARNLIQVDRRRFDGKVKSCRIHDIFHNLCVKVAKEINFFESIPENMARENFTISTRVQRVTTHNSIINYSFVDYKYEKLRTLMAFDNEEITTLNIQKLLRKSTFLKTLNLEFDFPRSGAFTSGYLESEIGNSSHLMYLRFVEPHSLIEFPYSISKLKNLQTFDARGCGHLCMSPYCLWEMMKHLKHVLLPPIKATDIRSCQEVLSVGFCICWLPNCTFQTEQMSFENLETLWCCEASLLPNTSLLEFPKLKKLGLYFRLCNFSRVKEILNGLSHSNKLEILKLHGRRSYNPNQTCPLQVPNLSKFENLLRLHLGVRIDYLPDLPQNLIKLTLVSTQLGHNPLPSLERLPKLKILKMGEFSCSCSLYCFGGPSIFPQLQVLEIRPQDAGFSLCLEEEVMPRLKQLRLHFTLWHVKIPNRIKELVVWWEYAVIDKLIIKFIVGMRERMASNSITQIPSWSVEADRLIDYPLLSMLLHAPTISS
ncbi:hypothetical protein NMG60_11013237 [Bertholletia excelsa]